MHVHAALEVQLLLECWVFFRLKQEKPVSLLEKNDIEKFFNGILPDGSNISGNVFVVGLFADAQSKGEKYFVLSLTYQTYTVCIHLLFNECNSHYEIVSIHAIYNNL